MNKEPKSVYKKVENCNYAVEIGRSMNFSMVNIGGLDIVHKDKKLILAIIWQLMRRCVVYMIWLAYYTYVSLYPSWSFSLRYTSHLTRLCFRMLCRTLLCTRHTLKVLAELAAHEGLTEVTEEHIIHWANTRVAGSGKSTTMLNFKDHSLQTGVFLLDLVAAVEPRAVNWDLVTAGTDEDEQLSNAKYCISVAQKIGACVFLTPEDIVEVKSKMIMTFVSSIWATDLSMQR